MEVIGVSHGLTQSEYRQWQSFAQRVGASNWHILDTGNPAHDAKHDRVHGAENTYYEFGAYAQVAAVVQTQGPYLILNNTLLKTRAVWAWGNRLHALPQKLTFPIYGDATPSPNSQIPEIPSPYYASWLFLVRDKDSLAGFCAAVQRATQQAITEESPAYKAYLAEWLMPKNRWYGWHGAKTPENLARKGKTIRWEHRLSIELATLNIHSFARLGPWHIAVQTLDKIKRHWASFVKY